MAQPAHNYLVHSDVFFSCTEKRHIGTEHFLPEHGVSHIYSGKIIVAEADRTHVFRAGDTVLFRRNQLAKFTKYPAGPVPFKSVAIFFRQSFLQQYYAAHAPAAGQPSTKALLLGRNPLLDSLFNSILPYYDLDHAVPEELAALKVREAITVLRTLNPAVDGILAGFAEPGKIDLADFMQRNYAFNIPLERFAYLTGRSLATFKRDFRKIFQTSPQRWLLQQRLSQAHFLMAEHGQKPSDVYLAVGFESLSHFSAAFKEMFGYAPSSLSLSR